MTDIEQLKFNLQEDAYPYFTDAQLKNLLDNYGDVEAASYRGCLIKAVNDSMNLGKLSTPDNSKYWKSLAKSYRPNAGGVLKRDDVDV